MKRGAVTGLPGHRPCAGSQNFSPREGAKVGRCQNTLWLAANRKGPEKSSDRFKACRAVILLLLQHETTLNSVIVKQKITAPFLSRQSKFEADNIGAMGPSPLRGDFGI